MVNCDVICGRTKKKVGYAFPPSLYKKVDKKLFVYSQTCWRSGGKENKPLFSVFQVKLCVQMLIFSSETLGKLMFIMKLHKEIESLSNSDYRPNDLYLKYQRFTP